MNPKYTAIIVGVLVGPVVWSAFVRLPGTIAQWLTEPLGVSGRGTRWLSWILAISFLTVTTFTFYDNVFLFWIAPSGLVPGSSRARTLEGTLLLSSLIGSFLIPIVAKIGSHLVRHHNTPGGRTIAGSDRATKDRRRPPAGT